MAGFTPDKPINEKTRAEEEEEDDDEKDPKVETLTGPLDYDLSDSILIPKEEDRDSNLLQQEFRDFSCSVMNEVNTNSYASSSSSRIYKPKEFQYSRARAIWQEHVNKRFHEASEVLEWEFSDYEKSQIQSMFRLLGIEDNSNQSSHQQQMMNQQQIVIPNRGSGLSSSSSSSSPRSDLNPNASPWRPKTTYQQQILRSDQSMNQNQQLYTIPNHGSDSISTSDHQNTLNPNASPWRPRSMNQHQHQFIIPNHGSISSATSDQNQQFGRQQQQQFSIPNRGSTSSATSDQNQPFGRQQQLNPSATPWRPQQYSPMQNQMITPAPGPPAFLHGNYFNHNVSVMQHQPQHFTRPETNQLMNYQQGDLRSVAPSGLQQQQVGVLDPEVAAAQQWFERNQQLQDLQLQIATDKASSRV